MIWILRDIRGSRTFRIPPGKTPGTVDRERIHDTQRDVRDEESRVAVRIVGYLACLAGAQPESKSKSRSYPCSLSMGQAGVAPICKAGAWELFAIPPWFELCVEVSPHNRRALVICTPLTLPRQLILLFCPTTPQSMPSPQASAPSAVYWGGLSSLTVLVDFCPDHMFTRSSSCDHES